MENELWMQNSLDPEWFGRITSEIVETNQKNGFGAQNRTFPEELSLIHSEITEAAREHADGHHELWFSPGGKPEGVGAELADIFIRLVDTCHRRHIHLDRVLEEINVEACLAFQQLELSCSNRFLMELHSLTSDLLECYRDGEPLDGDLMLNRTANLMAAIFAVAEHFDVQLLVEVDRKAAFNRTRPYKHGNKVI